MSDELPSVGDVNANTTTGTMAWCALSVCACAKHQLRYLLGWSQRRASRCLLYAQPHAVT